MNRKKLGVIVLLFMVLVVMAILSLGVGPSWLSPLGREFLIVYQVRLPRVVLGIFAGATLALVGAALQGILLNPLADPYILGVSSGAAFGAAIGILSGLPYSLVVPLFGFGGAALSILLVYNLAKFGGRIPTDTLLLSGVLVGFFFSSLVMLTMALGGKELHKIVFLLMGYLGLIFQRRDIIVYSIFFLVTMGCGIVIYSFSRELNILTLGEEGAKQLGVETETLKKTIFLVSSIMVGLVVALCGSIGFVGLVVPHITRLLLGPDHRILIPASLLLGAIFLLIADAIARTVAPVEIPVGVVTAIFGVPFFAYLLRTRRKAL